MKTTFPLNFCSSKFIFVTLGIIAFYCLTVTAQDRVNSDIDQLLSPAEEVFVEAAELVSPWRSSGCNRINREFREPNCHLVTAKEYITSDVVTLYNADGTIWYRFSLSFQSPEYFLKDTKMGFLPFSTDRGFIPLDTKIGDRFLLPHAVILRMVGESPNWYKVEVNEDTQETKFVLKSDPFWVKRKWSYWLYEGYNLKIDSSQSPLRNKPDGQIIKESSDLIFNRVRFLKADGDWAYVEGFVHPKKYYGWIRWRKGREILVGSIFNDFKIPESK